jgi:3-oxoacyl-[acyl-carrier protein] reductase
VSGTRLENRVAIVTGGARGIGRAIADAFRSEGAQVVIADRDASSVGDFEAIEMDVRDEGGHGRLVEAVLERHGRIDVMVNNAGIATAAPVREMTLDLWREMLDVDLTGVFLGCRAVLPRMVEQRFGRIINVASQLGLRGAPGLAHYCAAKAGVLGLTKALAREVAELGITVNAVCPGPTETDILRDVPGDVLEGIRQEIPLKRFASVDEIAPVVVLLASDEGSYFTGATLNVSGGHVM